MAHFAKIEDGNVTDIIVVANAVLDDGSETENEQQGKDLIAQIGKDGTWVQTSYNNNFRKQYAVIGGTYNSEKDIFINPKPLDCWGDVCESWSLDSNDDWQPPTEKPTEDPKEGGQWVWTEAFTTWLDTQVVYEDGFPTE
tara:strand:+ start:337 stop:756 length:420 start_codon:yes stop_codon:yes gene_type:complete